MKANNTTEKYNFNRIIIGVAVILSLPLIAMQFSNEVDWGVADFVIIGVLLLSAGLFYEVLSKKIRNTEKRYTLLAVVLAIVLYIWAELAVGIFTNIGD